MNEMYCIRILAFKYKLYNFWERNAKEIITLKIISATNILLCSVLRTTEILVSAHHRGNVIIVTFVADESKGRSISSQSIILIRKRCTVVSHPSPNLCPVSSYIIFVYFRMFQL